jgi:hypothetical protein
MTSDVVDVLDAGVGCARSNRGGKSGAPSKTVEASKTGEEVVSATEIIESDGFDGSAGVEFGCPEVTEIMESSAHGMSCFTHFALVLWWSFN